MLTFWDCSAGQELADLNGHSLPVHEWSDLCELRAERAGFTGEPFWRGTSMTDFHPLATQRPQRWERALAAAIFAASGQVAERSELLHGRAVLDDLPRSARSRLDLRDILGILAPLLAGFRLSRAQEFVREANRHRDASRVFSRLLDPEYVNLDIPLCAHRERAELAPRRLAGAPHRATFARVCSLLQLLLSNARVAGASVRFLQQGPTERAASCMFPSVFDEYATNGEVAQLLDTLAGHHATLRAWLSPYCNGKVAFEVGALDPLSIAAEADLDAALGPGWQRLSDEAPATKGSATWLSDPTANVALHKAVEHVARFMPEIGGKSPANGTDGATRKATMSDACVVEAALHWHNQRARMSRVGRALFELAFYRRWALNTRVRNGIGLGFDRDFSEFQRMAWSRAFDAQPDAAVPLLYARRTEDGRSGGALRHLSYRQFWFDDRPSP